MASTQSIADFLEQRLGYSIAEPLAQLRRLAGQDFGRTEFLPDLDAARDRIEAWMPLFYLPAAQTPTAAGLHLRPTDVHAQRLAFVMAADPGFFIEQAVSAEQLVYLGLLSTEAYGNYRNKVVPSFTNAISKVNELLGADFYALGRHGKFSSDDVSSLMIKVFGGTPQAFSVEARMAENPQEQLTYWQRGIALGTECMRLYVGAARIELDLGRRREAAQHVSRSLDCYHHTAFGVDLDAYFDLARPLLDEFPDLFSEDAAWQLREPDLYRWAVHADELYKAGHPERADKLLNDICHRSSDYTSVVPMFRRNYEALGWAWALALCDLRA